MRALMTIVLFALGCGWATAQMTIPSGPALGVASPLVIAGATSGAAAAPSGIPLGATQLDVGGLSPAPGPLFGSGCSAVSGLSSPTAGTFDGGGLASGATTGGCDTATTPTSSITGLASAGGAGTSALGIGSIPLGATEIDSGGLSPLVVTPAPGSNGDSTPGMSTAP